MGRDAFGIGHEVARGRGAAPGLRGGSRLSRGRGATLPWGRCAQPSTDPAGRKRHRCTVWWRTATRRSRGPGKKASRQRTGWRGFVDDIVYAFTDCGDLSRGFARVYCDSCRNEYLLAFSCSRRGFCPSCAAKRGAIFGPFLREEVLEDVGHCMWT
ncbi:MAG TPA: transposase zinc-binding domain-containing protein [Thermoanaerobaculia bacterium]|nr:transposase zinc-binding domain-containing protein [Thermoanaerobaculia bacterium]